MGTVDMDKTLGNVCLLFFSLSHIGTQTLLLSPIWIAEMLEEFKNYSTVVK